MASPSGEPAVSNFATPENGAFYAARPYGKLDPKKDEFRLLELLSGTGDDPVRCNLIEPPESGSLHYKTISYRAGDPGHTLLIEVNGHDFNTFATLGAALRRLRWPDNPRLLWADQICINQSDVDERGDQVQKMRQIYERADGVFAWLGHLENADAAFAALLDLQSEYDSAWGEFQKTLPEGVSDVDRHQGRNSVLFELGRSVKDRLVLAGTRGDDTELAGWSALSGIFRNEYWTRLWICQELIVSKTVTLLWDTKSIDWSGLDDVISVSTYISEIQDGEGAKPWSDGVSRFVGVSNGLMSMAIKMALLSRRREKWQKKKALDLKDLLVYGTGLKCADERDRIFGFCGLANVAYKIIPDYRKTIRLVYCETTVAIIGAESSLDVLAYCRHPTAPDPGKELPTWCPDWSRVTYANRRQSLLWDELSVGLYCRFRASKAAAGLWYTKPGELAGELLSHRSLHVTTLVIGTLLLGDLPTADVQTDEKGFEKLLESWAQLVAKYRPLTPEVMRELEKTATIDDRGYPDIQDPRSVTDALNYGRLKLDCVEGNRRFVVTRDGIMGMAPPHVREGDLACIILGSRVPYVLREAGGFYTLIGELYLSDGFMNGKAIDMMENKEIKRQMLEIK